LLDKSTIGVGVDGRFFARWQYRLIAKHFDHMISDIWYKVVVQLMDWLIERLSFFFLPLILIGMMHSCYQEQGVGST
jgi:hypothetical protein